MTSFSPRSWLKAWRSTSRAARRRTRRTAVRLHLEPLEERQLLATFVVTNANDAGPGSLRQAILTANTTTALDTIEFRVGSGPQNLVPTSPLPVIVTPVILTGATQPGYTGTPLITIHGQSAGSSAVGLFLGLGSTGSTVRALTVRSFDRGIVVGSGSNTIERCYIGIDPLQTLDAGNRDAGVVITNLSPSMPASNNVLRGNVISGNIRDGVRISGTLARNNIVGSSPGFFGNFIGTNATGTTAVPNGGDGVWIGNGASFNLIGGGPSPNVISGNTASGVAILGSNTLGNEVVGNFIGINSSGTALGNSNGAFVGQGARLNRIGINLLGQRNVISGNRQEGVVLTDAGTSNNFVQGNLIGTDVFGTAAIPNQRDGVWLRNGARDNTIGGTAAGTGNIISGNFLSGVALTHTGTTGNGVHGNHIGTTFAGSAPLGNGVGVRIAQGANGNTIGGSSSPAARNVIAANQLQGVLIRDVGTNNNVVQANYIGTNAAGTAALGNGVGVAIGLAARDNRIGGTTAGARNVISGNQNEGVSITGVDTLLNTVQGNYIGTNASGTTALGNGSHGVWVTSGANDNTIGGSAGGAGNVISGNGAAGVALTHGASDTRVQGNTIGLNAAGTAALGNLDGVLVAAGANSNFIGGSNAGQGNVIAGNQRHGVGLWDSGTIANAVRGNWIALNADSGVVIGDGASANAIGGEFTGEGNTIAYNGNNGVGTVAAGRGLLRGNAIYENGALGIDVDSDGVTFAHVVYLTAASTSGTDTTIEGWVIGAPDATYTVELFASAAADPSGFGEGEFALPGLHTVSTDADGYGYLSVTLPFPLTVGSCVSATATESDGTTGEFGNCLEVVPVGESLGASAGALSSAEASFTPPLSSPTSAPDAARALSLAEASRSAPPAVLPSREHPSVEGTTLWADGAPFRDHPPDGAAVDAFFGGEAPLPAEAPPRRPAAVLLSEDDCLSWERMLEFDEL